MLGVPYGDAVLHAESMARTQSRQIAAEIAQQGGPKDLDGKKIIALVAYLQRLGTDIKHAPPSESGGPLRASEPNTQTPKGPFAQAAEGTTHEAQ